MRTVLFCLAMTLSGAASADDLASANKLLEAKAYPQALKMLGQLAAADNADAQLRLGDLYWYGEGVGVNRDKADALFAQAAKGGSTAAAGALGRTRERQLRAGDIAYWTGGYDGADLKSGKYACERPAIPGVSKAREDIKATTAALNAWSACYRGVAANMADALPLGKRIPASVVVLMSDQELEQAKAHLDKTYAAAVASTKLDADLVIAQRDAWMDATVSYVTQEEKLADIETERILWVRELNRRAISRDIIPLRAPLPPPTAMR